MRDVSNDSPIGVVAGIIILIVVGFLLGFGLGTAVGISDYPVRIYVCSKCGEKIQAKDYEPKTQENLYIRRAK